MDGHLSANGEPWWKTATIYQIYPRSFADSDGDGDGDLRGIINHLDHVKELGVDALWLGPVYPSPQDDNGYDISDYQDIDPLFGTLADFDALLAAVHGHGMRLIIDLVVNHTSDEHPWFVRSRDEGPGGPQRDWYWWRPARTGRTPGTPGAEPNNWASWFGGSAWAYNASDGEYYLHLFSSKQPDLNWENTEVRQAVHEMMRWWIERGVDGFRLDVINLISKDPTLPDGPRRQSARYGRYGDGKPHYLNGPRIHAYLTEMRREVVLTSPRPLLMVGEMHGTSVEQAAQFTRPERLELDMIFQFEHMSLDNGPDGKFDPRPLRLTDLKQVMTRWQTPAAGWNALFWNNHDHCRVVSRYGDDSPGYRTRSATMLATVLHLHRGTPFVYQGEELGMANAPFTSIDDYRDIESLNHYQQAVSRGEAPDQVLRALRARSRDNSRTPMQWDDGPNAGFSTGKPWISVNPDHSAVNAAAQRADPDSVFHYYRRLISLRRSERTVIEGDFTMLMPDDESVYAFVRRNPHDGVELLVLGNFTGRQTTADIPDGWTGAPAVITNTAGEALTSGRLTLQPWEARVHRRSA
ncbi:alpha-glucosidase [Streptomyces sp. NPDC052020]|uniref:glycoside hydrolase family 13 protein n=1 Tax=Streptomyces sp. NPDC052020 TaxID=3155677 RepID=UPI00342303B9